MLKVNKDFRENIWAKRQKLRKLVIAVLRMEYGLKLEQSQKLIITPELKQAINILQFSSLELSEYLQQQVTENPVLELKELDEKENIDKMLEPEIDWKEVFNDKSDLGIPYTPEEKGTGYSMEHFLSQAPTLLEHLSLQLNLLPLTSKERKIGTYLLGNIDPNGYLRVELSEVCEKFDCSKVEVENVLTKIQSFDPPGVGARNLTECLLLQLRGQTSPDPIAENIIRKHLLDLAEGKWQKIAQSLEITPQEVQKAAQVIKTLDPKPGSRFASDKPRYIIPDIVVEEIEGEYIVLVNDSALPRLTINPLYEAILKNQNDQATVKFIEQKLNSALWLLKSIEQRRLTLYRVAKCIVDCQRSFLEKGIRYLRPLNLRQVADTLGIHESTVSRATANKYMQTPRGIFELKFFFATGIENKNGTTTSVESIKAIIRELLAAEDPTAPLSDQKISEILGSKGINISRRTVAKYRGEMAIPTAAKRKRFK